MNENFERETEGSSEMASFPICKAGQERANVQAYQWVPDTRETVYEAYTVLQKYIYVGVLNNPVSPPLYSFHWGVGRVAGYDNPIRTLYHALYFCAYLAFSSE